MKQINETNYLSDEGKVFVNKNNGLIYGWGISLGLNDSIDNYEEVDCPEEYKGNHDYDNTVNNTSKENNKNTARKKIIE